MAAGLFAKGARLRGANDTSVASGGFLDGGRKVHEYVAAILEPKGIDLSQKRSQKLSADVVEPADLILTMTSEHARSVVSVAPRAVGDSTRDWLDDLNESNRRVYLGDDALLDIPDPIGHPLRTFEGLASELENTIAWILSCAYPARS